jgi:hypothetical protein
MARPIRMLHLEDSPRDAELVRHKLEAEGLSCNITLASRYHRRHGAHGGVEGSPAGPRIDRGRGSGRPALGERGPGTIAPDSRQSTWECKFTHQGEVVLRVASEASIPPEVVLHVSVRDTASAFRWTNSNAFSKPLRMPTAP